MEVGEVKESENKKMRKSKEMLEQKKKHKVLLNSLRIRLSRPMFMFHTNHWTTLTFVWVHSMQVVIL